MHVETFSGDESGTKYNQHILECVELQKNVENCPGQRLLTVVRTILAAGKRYIKYTYIKKECHYPYPIQNEYSSE